MFDFDPVDLSAAEVVPAGDYTAIVEKGETKQSAAGNPMINWTFSIVGGEHNNRKLFYCTVLLDHAIFALNDLVKGTGLDCDPKRFTAEDANKILNQNINIRVSIDSTGDSDQNSVKILKKQ